MLNESKPNKKLVVRPFSFILFPPTFGSILGHLGELGEGRGLWLWSGSVHNDRSLFMVNSVFFLWGTSSAVAQ